MDKSTKENISLEPQPNNEQTDDNSQVSPSIANAVLAESVSVKPILFSGEMVRAILEGRKTQTRRIVKMRDGSLMQDDDLSTHLDNSFDCVMDFTKTYPYWQKLNCPYGNINDVLWVRETSQYADSSVNFNPGWVYRATDPDWETMEGWTWKPSIFMPKRACRIFLKIKNIRVERLRDISEEDAMREGVSVAECCHAYYHGFSLLWQKINGRKSWDENPFVWVIIFECERPFGFC